MHRSLLTKSINDTVDQLKIQITLISLLNHELGYPKAYNKIHPSPSLVVGALGLD